MLKKLLKGGGKTGQVGPLSGWPPTLREPVTSRQKILLVMVTGAFNSEAGA